MASYRFHDLSRDERANTLTHGVGALLSLVGLAVLTQRSLWYDSLLHLVAVGVYGLSLVSVYTASTLHHLATAPRVKRFFLWLDHSCIYALIAGTYTPFLLLVLKGTTGTVLLGTIWGLGLLGVLSKTVWRLRSDLLSLPFYLLMGWLIVVVIRPFSVLMAPGGLALLVAGGLCYSLGIVFFLVRMTYAHAVWHLFVLAGSGLHFACVLIYVVPFP
jgi:hemolysin III